MVVISCPECAGLSFSLVTCECAAGGGRFARETADGTYQECPICRGAGSVAEGCTRCRQRGRRRAQLVLTVANLDTGVVASANIVPGSLEPSPATDGRWRLPLAPVLDELAYAVGAGSVTDISAPPQPISEPAVWLPRQWHPELEAEQRYALEAEAIAGQDHYPWRLFIGRTAAQPAPDLDRVLGRLCAVADLLCLDLVVEARRRPRGTLSWDVRYELPGPDVPALPRIRADNLPSAVTTTTIVDAFDGLTERGRTAPAYTIRLATPARTGPPQVNLDQVERRLIADIQAASGAQAIWRDGRWWHTRLRPGGTTVLFTERETGQLDWHRVTTLLRNAEPPAPSWYGEPIAHTPCPDCDPRSELRRCYCTMGGQPAEPGCAACAGTGYAKSTMACPTCLDSHRVYPTAVVTITDLRARVVHQLWQPGPDEPGTLVATQANGNPAYQVPDRYRLARWARDFGVRPEDLAELAGGHEIGQDLHDGIITATWAGTDPVTEYVASASRGQPAARLLILAAIPDAPTLVEVIRLAIGLHLGILVTVENHRLHASDPTRLHGERWQVQLVPPGQRDGFSPPLFPSLEAALAHCRENLEDTLVRVVPADPTEPIVVPQTLAPAALTDPAPLISRLGYHYAGQAVTVRLELGGCRVYLHERDSIRPLARATTLTDAMSALGLRPS